MNYPVIGLQTFQLPHLADLDVLVNPPPLRAKTKLMKDP